METNRKVAEDIVRTSIVGVEDLTSITLITKALDDKDADSCCRS